MREFTYADLQDMAENQSIKKTKEWLLTVINLLRLPAGWKQKVHFDWLDKRTWTEGIPTRISIEKRNTDKTVLSFWAYDTNKTKVSDEESFNEFINELIIANGLDAKKVHTVLWLAKEIVTEPDGFGINHNLEPREKDLFRYIFNKLYYSQDWNEDNIIILKDNVKTLVNFFRKYLKKKLFSLDYSARSNLAYFFPPVEDLGDRTRESKFFTSLQFENAFFEALYHHPKEFETLLQTVKISKPENFWKYVLYLRGTPRESFFKRLFDTSNTKEKVRETLDLLDKCDTATVAILAEGNHKYVSQKMSELKTLVNDYSLSKQQIRLFAELLWKNQSFREALLENNSLHDIVEVLQKEQDASLIKKAAEKSIEEGIDIAKALKIVRQEANEEMADFDVQRDIGFNVRRRRLR